MVTKPIKNLLFCLVIMLACVETIFSMQDQGNMYNAIVEQLIKNIDSKEIQIHQLSENIRNVFDSFINKADLAEKSISTRYKKLQQKLRSAAKPITSAAQMYTAEEIKKFNKNESEENLIQLIDSLQREDFIFICDSKKQSKARGTVWCSKEETKKIQKNLKKNWVVRDEIEDLFEEFQKLGIPNYSDIINKLFVDKRTKILTDIPLEH